MRFILILALLISTPVLAVPRPAIHCADPDNILVADWRPATGARYRLRMNKKSTTMPDTAVAPMLLLMWAGDLRCTVEKR